MAYADQQMSGNKITALIIVAILHVVVGYALVSGLAYSAFKKVKEVTSAVKIEEDKPPEEPPPPPPKQDTPPPPIVAPPPPISFNAPAPQVQAVTTPPPVVAPAPVVLPPAPAAPPPPPPPKFQPKGASPKGSPANWATSNDYPSRALREEREGVTGFRVTIGTDGKVVDCQITKSSGSPDLDDATCANVRRRARFTPATDGEGNPTTGSYASSIRWVIPKD
ncbi:MAG: energy transducer TonB [Novosphingobium sp. SCN 66-18]|nr:MAG: energy transducer TonB [Novosphingobium sp. SCN 66-18]